MRHDWRDETRSEATKLSPWRLGDVLEELLDRYGLTESCSAAACSAAAYSGATGTSAIGGEAGFFSTSDLPSAAAAIY